MVFAFKLNPKGAFFFLLWTDTANGVPMFLGLHLFNRMGKQTYVLKSEDWMTGIWQSTIAQGSQMC